MTDDTVPTTSDETSATPTIRTGLVEDDWPHYDQTAISKVVNRVEIESVDLAGSFFGRRDEDAFPEPVPNARPDFGVDPQWWLSADETLLSCVITFTTFFEETDAPYELMARYRVRYRLDPGDPLTDDEISVFTSWNAVFNTWSYWREFVSSTLARAELPQVVVPVIRVPGWNKRLQTED